MVCYLTVGKVFSGFVDFSSMEIDPRSKRAAESVAMKA